MAYRRIATLIASAAMIACSGCGGSSTKTTSGASTSASASTQSTAAKPPLSVPAFIAQADAICARVNTEMSTNPTTGVGRSLVTIAAELAAYERTAAGEMRSLVPPASLARDWKQIVDDHLAIAEDTTKLSEVAAAGDHAAEHRLIIAGAPLQQQMLSLAKRDGLTSCSQPG